MADAQLQIIIKARNEAKKEFDKLNQQVNTLKGSSGGLSKTIGDLDSKFKSVTGMSLGFASAAGLSGAAISGVVKFMKDAVTETVAYATEVDNLSRLLGISTEDTSRLIQASDDLFLSQEKLSAGLQAATRQGIDVSIEGLKKLAEQYLALPAGVERSEFVLKTFGRSGAEMGKLMEQGAAGIDAATAAISNSLVVTKQSMVAVMNYKRSVDNLQDAWQGVKYSVGQAVIPQLDLLLRQLTKGTDTVEEYYETVNDLNEQIMHLEKYGRQAGLSQEEVNDQIAAARAKIDEATTSFDAYNQQVAEAAQEQETLNNKLDDLKAIMGGQFGNTIDDFNLKVRDLKTEQSGVVARIKELEGLKYLTPAQKQELDDLRQKHGDIAVALQDLQLQHETTMKTMAMNMIIAKAASDGLTETEVSNITDIMEAWGLWDEETARVIDNINAIDLNDANAEIDGLQANILGIPDRTITITVQARYEGDYTGAGWTIGKMERDMGVDLNGNGIIGAARGANFTVPPGFPNDSMLLGVSSGEHVKVTPAPNNGGGATIVFNYSPAVSLSDRTEMETRILPLMRRLMARV